MIAKRAEGCHREKKRSVGLAVVVTLVVAMAALSYAFVAFADPGGLSGGKRVNHTFDGASYTFEGAGGSPAGMHEFSYMVSGLSGPIALNSTTVSIYTTAGGLAGGFTFYLAVSVGPSTPTTANITGRVCAAEYIGSGTPAAYDDGSASTCDVANGDTVSVLLPSSECGSTTQCIPVAVLNGETVTVGQFTIGSGSIAFPTDTGSWGGAPTVAPGDDYCMYIPCDY
jgi:hypothetical protein